jgi:hypothetical protein
LPPGPLGIVTILSDLSAIWRVQARMVADVAVVRGKTTYLSRERMLYCLFRHVAGHVVRSLVVRVGERVLIKRISLRVLQRILPRLELTFTQQLVGRMISRWLPVVGAASIATYAYYDTVRVERRRSIYSAGISKSKAMKRGNLVQLVNNCGVLLTLKFIHKEFRYMEIIHELINS